MKSIACIYGHGIMREREGGFYCAICGFEIPKESDKGVEVIEELNFDEPEEKKKTIKRSSKKK